DEPLAEVESADAESVIEESPLAQESEAAEIIRANDPAWVEQMFAEAEAEGLRTRTAERHALHPVEDEDDDEPAVVKAARDVAGVSASSGDTALRALVGAP